MGDAFHLYLFPGIHGEAARSMPFTAGCVARRPHMSSHSLTDLVKLVGVMREAGWVNLTLAIPSSPVADNPHAAETVDVFLTAHELPTGYQLISAFRGAFGHLPGDHLIARWAQAFAHLHRCRHINPANTARIDTRRAELAELVDAWVANHSRLPDRDYGAALDELAAAYIGFEAKFHARAPVDFDELHRAWTIVAGHVIDWGDLRTGQAAVSRPLQLSSPISSD
ncbi:hypothetical protein [Nocardia sp. NPDC055049]